MAREAQDILVILRQAKDKLQETQATLDAGTPGHNDVYGLWLQVHALQGQVLAVFDQLPDLAVVVESAPQTALRPVPETAAWVALDQAYFVGERVDGSFYASGRTESGGWKALYHGNNQNSFKTADGAVRRVARERAKREAN